MKCDVCKKEVDIAKSSSLYYNSIYYRGHDLCMRNLEIELKYPRYKSR